ADAIADLASERLGVGSCRALDPYRDDGPLVDGGAPRAVRSPERVLAWLDREPGQARGGLAPRGFAARDQFLAAFEIDEGDASEVGRDENVAGPQCGDRYRDVLLGEDVDHLLRDTERRGKRFTRQERCTDVDRDDDVR